MNRKKIKTTASKTAAPTGPATPASPTAPAPQTATLTFKITNTEPGDTSITASCNGVSKPITKSGSISFSNVNNGDLIEVMGDSLGTTTITIDLSAAPPSMTFPQGHINGQFFIN